MAEEGKVGKTVVNKSVPDKSTVKSVTAVNKVKQVFTAVSS